MLVLTDEKLIEIFYEELWPKIEPIMAGQFYSLTGQDAILVTIMHKRNILPTGFVVSEIVDAERNEDCKATLLFAG